MEAAKAASMAEVQRADQRQRLTSSQGGSRRRNRSRGGRRRANDMAGDDDDGFDAAATTAAVGDGRLLAINRPASRDKGFNADYNNDEYGDE